MIDLEVLLNDGLPDEPILELDSALVLSQIPNFSSDKLCEMIVCNRYFVIHSDITVACMQELSNRRANGDLFNFEQKIKNLYKELPELEISIPDMNPIIKAALSIKLS